MEGNIYHTQYYNEPWGGNSFKTKRVFELDEIASEVIQLVNGKSSIAQIIDQLTNKFSGAPREQISKDVIGMLQPLADKGFVINE